MCLKLNPKLVVTVDIYIDFGRMKLETEQCLLSPVSGCFKTLQHMAAHCNTLEHNMDFQCRICCSYLVVAVKGCLLAYSCLE